MTNDHTILFVLRRGALGLFAFLMIASFYASSPAYASVSAGATSAHQEAKQGYERDRDDCDKAVKAAAKSGAAYRVAAVHDMWMTSIDRDRKSPKNSPRGSIMRNHCLGKVLDPNGFFKQLRDMFDSPPDPTHPERGILEVLTRRVVTGIMTEILHRSCEWAADALNNVMRSICLPLPNFGFELNLEFPDLGNMHSCSGSNLSMADVIRFTSNIRQVPYPNTAREFVRYARGRTSSGRPIY